MQSPSFLGHQRRLLEGRGRSNCQTLFAMTEIPSDNHIRAMLDPVSPDAFQPAFDATIRSLEAGGGLAPFQRLGGQSGRGKALVGHVRQSRCCSSDPSASR
jgi:hypothetical protein